MKGRMFRSTKHPDAFKKNTSINIHKNVKSGWTVDTGWEIFGIMIKTFHHCKAFITIDGLPVRCLIRKVEGIGQYEVDIEGKEELPEHAS